MLNRLAIKTCSQLGCETETFKRGHGFDQDVVLHDEGTKLTEITVFKLLAVYFDIPAYFSLRADV